jgi:hypothetical protein
MYHTTKTNQLTGGDNNRRPYIRAFFAQLHPLAHSTWRPARAHDELLIVPWWTASSSSYGSGVVCMPSSLEVRRQNGLITGPDHGLLRLLQLQAGPRPHGYATCTPLRSSLTTACRIASAVRVSVYTRRRQRTVAARYQHQQAVLKAPLRAILTTQKSGPLPATTWPFGPLFVAGPNPRRGRIIASRTNIRHVALSCCSMSRGESPDCVALLCVQQ